MTARYLIKRVRRRLDQVPLEVESVETDSDVIGSISTEFSNEDLIDRINRGIHSIVSKTKAQHVPVAIEEKTSASAIENSSVRLLTRRVFGSDDGGSTWIRAFERGSEHQNQTRTREIQQATAEYPVFIHQDGIFQLFPEDLDVKAFVVEAPPGADAPNDTLALDERFESALIDYVAASCYQTMKQKELSKFFFQLFNKDLRPYRLDMRYSTSRVSDDQEVDVE